MRISLALPLFLLAIIAFATSDGVPAAAEEKAAGAIRVEYIPPKSPEHRATYDLLRERGALEKVQIGFSAFQLPFDVKIRTMECGVANSSYQLIDHVPTVTLCYEYLEEICHSMPEGTAVAGITREDAVGGQFFFAVAHEFGHLVFDVYDVPIFGREEDAADNFAAYLILQMRQDAHRLVKGAAFSYHMYIKDFKDNPPTTLRLAAFASNHGQPEERFFNLLCIAYGSDPKEYVDLVGTMMGPLPQARAKDCPYEFEVLRDAFRKEISPHMDMALAAKVMETQWLTAVVGARPPRPPEALR